MPNLNDDLEQRLYELTDRVRKLRQGSFEGLPAPNLNEDLEQRLYELSALRQKAKKLRRGGLKALRGIRNITIYGKIEPKDAGDEKYYGHWITSGNAVEAALLVRVQSHRDMSDDDEENDAADASPELKERLNNIKLKSLFPSITKTIQVLPPESKGESEDVILIRVNRNRLDAEEGEDEGVVVKKFVEFLDSTVPVLTAARVMHALVGRAETVFTRATMVCYYRIVRELYFAWQPDWIIGAARANVGGSASAFVTSECIRAIRAFENTINRTVAFFRNTRDLWDKHQRLAQMLDDFGAGDDDHPLRTWADQAIERRWLDWYISSNPRRGEIAVKGVLADLPKDVNMKTVDAYLKALPKRLEEYVQEAHAEIKDARDEILHIRLEQNPLIKKDPQSKDREQPKDGDEKDGERPSRKEKTKEDYDQEEAERVFQHTESAHEVAFRAVARGITETKRAAEFVTGQSLDTILEEFIRQFEDISRRIHRILEPAKRYVRNVVNRELALSNIERGRFDAGELAFAAASFGATTDWRKSERLRQACALLVQHMPDSGSLPTRQPFHSNTRGYRLLPIGCEMIRSFAQLLQRSGYEFEPELMRRMLNIFEEKRLPPPLAGEEVDRFAWNFEGAPHPDKPCTWVTCVAVLALDRIIRMLNERINAIVLKHFEVIRPENPHTNLGLNDLFYPDYGVSRLEPWRSRSPGVPRSLAIRLEQMRAHVQRAKLPKAYKDKGNYSVILYGPPGTGKTTLVEALALSSRAPLIRLAPSDLAVQGSDLVEGRARAVFEALSMLTQAVIILDEFEPVLLERDRAKLERLKLADPSDKSASSFLVTGMLPKLIKLHDAAKRQSVVYCLATNFIEKIDSAAKRKGRFDLHMPVYHPDPLSRAGEFLYRNTPPTREHSASESGRDIKREGRLLMVVSNTAYAAAGGLAEVHFRPSVAPAYYDYYWKAQPEGDKSEKGTKPDPNESGLSADEKAEREAIEKWEDEISKPTLRKQVSGGLDMVVQCLTPPSE